MTGKTPTFAIVMFLLGATLLAWMGVARAQTQGAAADEADVLFLLGNQAYQQKDFRQALAWYLASNRLAPNRNVVFNIARCFEQLKQYVEAYRYYRSLESPQIKSGERRVLRQALDRVRPYVAVLNLESFPAGATVYVNRRELGAYGTTPMELALAPGRYKIILELAGFEPYEEGAVELVPEKSAFLKAKLKQITGTLRISGSPVGAQVQVEDPFGEAVASLPAELYLSPGERRILVSQSGYAPHEARAIIRAGELTEINVELMPQTGSLLVQCDERDALILLDGKPAGFTPTVIDGVVTGRHRVVVRKEGFHPFVRDIDIAPEARLSLEAKLVIADDVAAASRLKERARDAPASVSLIGRPEMDAFGYASVADALLAVRGTFSSNDYTYRSIGIRGCSPFGEYGNRLLVQLDGHTVNDDWIGSSYLEFDLLPELKQLERIELIRGPGSAIYGTGAFFGVLNLVSLDLPAENFLRGGISSLGPGVWRASAGAGAKLSEELGLWLDGGGLYGQGGDFYSPARLGSAEAPDGMARDVGGFHSGGLLGKLIWHRVILQWYFNQRDLQVPTAAFGTVFGDRRFRIMDRRAFVEARFEPELSKSFQVLSRLYYDRSEYAGTYPYADPNIGTTSESYRGDWAGAELRSVWRLLQALRLTFGGGYEAHFDNRARGKNSADDAVFLWERHPFHLLYSYLVADYSPAEILTLSAGGRFDGWWIQDLPQVGGGASDRFLYSANPRLAVILHPVREGTLKLMGGRAFRAPSIYELTYNDGGLTQVPSPNLSPEIVYTAEAEYTQGLSAGIWATGCVFFNHVSKLIEQAGGGTPADPLFYRNQQDSLWTLGAEVELRREFRQGWMLGVQYSFHHTRLSNLTGGAELVNSPAHLAGMKVVLPLAGRELKLASRLLVESGRLDRTGRRTEPTLLWDLVLSGELLSSKLHYSLGVRNLLDWRYYQPVGEEILDPVLRQPGLSVFLNLEFLY